MPTDSRTQALLAALQRWNRSHAQNQRIDPAAELRVARQEGLSGGIGDGGHAFGPNQLNDAGGVLTGKLQGSPAQKNEWAWSPKGLEYALAGVARAAGGEHGPGAVEDIVRKFERPADPNGEVARALSGLQLGGAAATGAPLSAGPAGPAAAPDQRRQAILALISSFGQTDGQGLGPFLAALQASRATPAPSAGALLATAAAPQTATPTPGAPTASTAGGGIAELLQEGTGGPTHSTGPHVHAAFTNPQLELAAIQRARQLGLSILENPYVGDAPAPGVHAQNSYHYRDFPGSYNGRKLGEAIDVSGPHSDAFYQWLKARR